MIQGRDTRVIIQQIVQPDRASSIHLQPSGTRDQAGIGTGSPELLSESIRLQRLPDLPEGHEDGKETADPGAILAQNLEGRGGSTAHDEKMGNLEGNGVETMKEAALKDRKSGSGRKKTN